MKLKTLRQKEIQDILFKDKWENLLDCDTREALRLEYAMESGEWPRPGDRLKFISIPEIHWYEEIITNSRKLTVGEIYTVTKVDLGSSYCYVCLEGFGEDIFSFISFEE